MRKLFLFMVISLFILNSLSLISAEEFGYNLLSQGTDLNPVTNLTFAWVNASDFWDGLDTFNGTQMDDGANSQTLNIKESWLTAFGNARWLRWLTDSPGLYNNSDTIFLNMTFVNETIDQKIASVEYNASEITTVDGTLDAGNLASVLVRDDDNSYNVSEGSGADPLTIIVNFTGVANFNIIQMREWYVGGSGHIIDVGVFLCAGGGYDSHGFLTDMETWTLTQIDEFNPTQHICGLDQNVSVRIKHLSNGIPSHDFYLDSIHLIQGASVSSPTEVDPLSIHSSGDVALTGNWNYGAFDINGSGDITTTGSGKFSNIGIGTTPSAAAGIIDRQSKTAAYNGADIAIAAEPASAGQSFIGLAFNAYPQAGSDTIATLSGMFGGVNNVGFSTSTSTITEAAAVRGQVSLLGSLGGGGPTATNAYLFKGDSMSAGANAVITNAYGLSLPDITAGGTLNYAIKTGAGLVDFGDNVNISGNLTVAEQTKTDSIFIGNTTTNMTISNQAIGGNPFSYFVAQGGGFIFDTSVLIHPPQSGISDSSFFVLYARDFSNGTFFTYEPDGHLEITDFALANPWFDVVMDMNVTEDFHVAKNTLLDGTLHAGTTTILPKLDDLYGFNFSGKSGNPGSSARWDMGEADGTLPFLPGFSAGSFIVNLNNASEGTTRGLDGQFIINQTGTSVLPTLAVYDGNTTAISVWGEHNASFTGYITRTPSLSNYNGNLLSLLPAKENILNEFGKLEKSNLLPGEFATSPKRDMNSCVSQTFDVYCYNVTTQTEREVITTPGVFEIETTYKIETICENQEPRESYWTEQKTQTNCPVVQEDALMLDNVAMNNRVLVNELREENSLLKQDLCSLGIQRWCTPQF